MSEAPERIANPWERIYAWNDGPSWAQGQVWRRFNHGGTGTPYLRADVAADEKRRRDVLIADLVQALETVRTALESEDGLDDSDAYRSVRAALHRAERFKAEHGSTGEARSRPKGPTPEAGYQSLLRETAGERLGATK